MADNTTLATDQQADDNVEIQLGLQQKTVDLIKALSEKTNTPNPADTISSSVQLASDLIDEVKNGAILYLQKSDGTKQQLKITGI